jgi:CIC family chloride channel protein
MNALLRHVSAGVRDVYRRFRTSETLVMLTMALLVGIGAGYGAVAFRQIIHIANNFFFQTLASWLGFLGRYYVVILPALGGLIATL